MAPKGTKRGRPTSPAATAKKQATDKVHAIAAAIKDSSALPASCKSMLVSMLPSSLAVYADDRHALQTTAVEIAGQALAAVQAEKEAAVTSLQGVVDSVDVEKATRAAATEAAKAELEKLAAAEEAAKGTVAGDSEAVSKAKEAASTAKSALAAKEKEVASTTDKLAKLEGAFKDHFEPFKEVAASGVSGSAALRHLGKVLVDSGCEEGLAKSIQETLKKDKVDRGSFDGLVEAQVAEELKKHTTATSASLGEIQAAKASLASALESADASLQAAVAKSDASASTLSEAVAARKAAESALTTAEKAVVSLESEVAKAEKDLAGAKKALGALQEGALAFYAELQVFAPPPPPVEEPAAVEVEAKPEEAAAPAETVA